ncbi:MAG: hypothetical protein LBC71_03455 [Oscillospiraceae bacterium]|jgi:hypothetical protein|nr:hypothetical protein [Oscillospiraceae bacterium]
MVGEVRYKKILSVLLSVAVLSTTACISNTNEEKVDITTLQEPQTSKSSQSQTTEQTEATTMLSDPQLIMEKDSDMPIPFENIGGDENWFFYMRYLSRFSAFPGMITDEIAQQMGWVSTNKEFDRAVKETWGENYLIDWDSQNRVTDFPGIIWYITEFEIPDEVIVNSIRKHNERLWSYVNENTYMPGFLLSIFTEEDIKVILSRDPERVTAQFAEETAIVVGDKAFEPYWLYLHSTEAYEEVGITPEMVEEKLDLYAEFEFTAEADEAFSAKLSEFIGEEVSLRRIRSRNHGRRS